MASEPGRSYLPSEAGNLFREAQAYFYGKGAIQDKTKAAALFREAAELGYPQAQEALAGILLKGEGVSINEREARLWYSKASAAGSSAAQYQLGLIYLSARSVERNDAEAAFWFAKAAQQGNPKAQLMFAEMLDKGRGLEANPAEAFDWYMKASAGGEFEAALKIANAYLAGRGVGQNDVQARVWLEKSVTGRSGYPESMLLLGQFYVEGRGGGKLQKEGLELLHKAAGRGSARAATYLALLYNSGTYLPKSYLEEYCWHYVAAILSADGAFEKLKAIEAQLLSDDLEVASARTMKRLADLGLDDKRHESLKTKLFAWRLNREKTTTDKVSQPRQTDEGGGRKQKSSVDEAARQSDLAARPQVVVEPVLISKIDLSQANIPQLKGLEVDLIPSLPESRISRSDEPKSSKPKAIRGTDSTDSDDLYKSATDLIYPPKGTQPSFNEAVPMLQQASLKGHVGAKRELAVLLSNGLGVPKDEVAAFKLSFEAAEKGDPIAQVNVGHAYLRGLGVQMDYEKALQYYQKAARQKNEQAYVSLGVVYLKGLAGKPDFQLAKDHFEKSYNLNSSEGPFWLGRMYIDGEGVEKNITQARMWLSRAAYRGNKRAEIMLRTIREESAAYDISTLDETPVPKFQARPNYPFAMRREGIPGEVVVDFIIDIYGNVKEAYALRSSRVEFEAAAVQAVSLWKFKPGKKGGAPVATHMQVPIVFTLNE